MAQKFEPKNVRFWGKITGTSADYWIVEGEKEAPAGGAEPAPDVEPRGTGVNKYCYWVSTSLTGDWTELPDTTPTLIRQARKIKRLFTGVLSSEVVTNPYFSGKEKELLRAQIARISQATYLTPIGIHKLAEGNDRETTECDEAEKKVPPFKDLLKPSSWCHLLPNILKCGRTSHIQPEPPKEGGAEFDPVKALQELIIRDPYDDRLKPISKDPGIDEDYFKGAWTIRQIGDCIITKDEKGKKEETSGIIMIRSLIWPGNYSLYQGKRLINLYIGSGLKSDGLQYYPNATPIIQKEPVDLPDQPEPNPKEAPIISKSKAEQLAKLELILSNEEAFKKELDIAFDHIDTDKSGTLEPKELETFLVEVLDDIGINIADNKEAVAAFMKQFDTDKSGSITKDELGKPFKVLLSGWAAILKATSAEK